MQQNKIKKFRDNPKGKDSKRKPSKVESKEIGRCM